MFSEIETDESIVHAFMYTAPLKKVVGVPFLFISAKAVTWYRNFDTKLLMLCF